MYLARTDFCTVPSYTCPEKIIRIVTVSTLIINIYCQLGHGTEFVGAWLRDVFMLAAVLYLDDSDLLHVAKGLSTDDELLASVQSATNAWAGLVHVTGGSLKPQKCFWYMMGW
jgi:hypothetical protein